MQQAVILLALLAVSLEENETSMKIKGALLLAVLLAVNFKACRLGVKLESLIVLEDVVCVL